MNGFDQTPELAFTETDDDDYLLINTTAENSDLTQQEVDEIADLLKTMTAIVDDQFQAEEITNLLKIMIIIADCQAQAQAIKNDPKDTLRKMNFDMLTQYFINMWAWIHPQENETLKVREYFDTHCLKK
ncbi:MAG: hypothetical protein KIT27_11375 [Legionellales bacterium]|nr:hypothetical protein [Legionellales bacterium]